MKGFQSILISFLLLTIHLQSQDVFEAVKNNDPILVKKLVESDPSLLNAADEAGNTLLHHAAMSGALSVAEYLLAKGADINAENTQKNTPLHEAIQSRKENAAFLLIAKGADVGRANVSGQTPLHRAALTNQKSIGEKLIACGAAIDLKDIYGRTPFLYVARQYGNVGFGKLLLEKGADIHTKDRDNQMALNLAAWRGFTDFIDILLDNGAEYDTSRNGARLMFLFSAQCGSLRLFKVVLEREKELPSDGSFSGSIMRNAVIGGSIDIVNLLLAKGIPLEEQTDRYGWTPVHVAAANGRAAMIRLLAERKFDISKRTLSGNSPFNIAEEKRHAEVMKVIRELKGDTAPRQFPRLNGAYLGQNPPNGEPRLFAPDIISSVVGDDNHGGITFAPGGREIYWNSRGKIWTMKLRDGVWTEPETVSFSSVVSAMDDNPFITSDGKSMFFTSTRQGSVGSGKENIWMVNRTSSGWSEPRPVDSGVNAVSLHWGISVSDAGNLYFGGTGRDGFGGADIYCSRFEKGAYTAPVNLGPVINGAESDHCPFIAGDESYLIFSRFGREDRGFFISYKSETGEWLPPVKIYEGLEGVCPLMTRDGRYFFYNSDGIYWMPARFIEKLSPKKISKGE